MIMPWDMSNYPSSLKNFNQTTKKKAIDIANALVDEGYDEDRAIPIATEQAKEWYNDRNKQERKTEIKQTHPTKRESGEHSRPELLDKPEMVIPHDKQWAVQSKDAKKPSKLFDNKEEAISYGQKVAKNKKTELIIERQDGSRQDTIRYYDQ